jgi:magnesium transporter
MLMMKLERTNFLGLNEEEREFLQDLIVDTSQALEMANIYTNILSSTMDAFASIISNNLNSVMKRLTFHHHHSFTAYSCHEYLWNEC